MSILVRIPTPLRPVTGGLDRVHADGNTVGEVLRGVEHRYPGVLARLLDDSGDLRRYVNVYLNGEDVGYLGGLETPASRDDELTIVPAVAGGATPPSNPFCT
ncbi:MAG: MoaD/ThiS family protein [Chloroflexi bacterium]|nr:MoaD/ThiS family protein [Chloroflexota bacterium]